jgi:hypothetical protein
MLLWVKQIQSGGGRMYQPGQYTQYYNLMEAQSGGGTGLKEQYRPAIAPVGTILPSKPGTIGYTGPETTTAPVADIAGVPLNIETTPASLPLSGETTPTSLQFDNPERAERIGGGLATTQDYATALSKVGAGTEEQKRRSVSDYAQNEAYGLLNKAASTPGGLSDLYNNYIKGTAVNSRAFDFGRDASTMNTATAMNPQYKQNIIDQIAYTMQQNTPYRKTYPFENASMQELMPAGTIGSKNFESNITTPQEAAALARYIALQRGVDMQQYDAEQAATNAGTLDDFYRNLGLQNSETM